jgi:hypothetical protein
MSAGTGPGPSGDPRVSGTTAGTSGGSVRTTERSSGPAESYTESHSMSREGDIAVTGRDESETNRRDRIRWGPVWAGFVVAIGTFLLLQLALVALGAVTLGQPDTASAWWTAAAALLAFLLGGITAGATAMWRGADDGLLHGVVMWAMGLVALLAFSAIGSGLALGTIDATEVFEGTTAAEVQEALDADDTQEAAGRALLGLVAALAAAAVGGVIGAKMWPREREGARMVMSRSGGVTQTGEARGGEVRREVRRESR